MTSRPLTDQNIFFYHNSESPGGSKLCENPPTNAENIGIICSDVLFNSLPDDKTLDWSKFKAFADDKINATNIEICFGKSRKYCGKRRKCCLPSFSPFPTMFSTGFLYKVVESRDCVVKS